MTEASKIKVRALSECGVLITGGTSGVGLATAIQFAAAGVTRIGLVGRNQARGQQARDAVLKLSPDTQVEFIAADANQIDQAVRAAEQAKAKLGSIDVLVNSTVAAYVPILFHDMPIADIEPTMVQQIMAPLLMCRIVLPWMRERGGGAIINIASDAAKVTTPGETVLGAAMAAITMFSRTLAMEAKRNGVRVNAVTPSVIEGTLTYDRVHQSAFSSKLFEKVARMAHLGIVQPDDLAALIVFLASPQAARMTGQVISVNGGISAG